MGDDVTQLTMVNQSASSTTIVYFDPGLAKGIHSKIAISGLSFTRFRFDCIRAGAKAFGPFGGVPTAFPVGLVLPMISLDVVGMANFKFH